MTSRRNVWVLIGSNLFGGIGVAAAVAIVSLLVEQVASTAAAGFAQATAALGAGLAAVPLANLAHRRGRRISLGLGYIVPIIGGGIVIFAAMNAHIILLFFGLALFGVAQAVNLQSRYAAAENATVATRARTMSIVIWATTIGSVLGPNLIEPGESLGGLLGVPMYAGAYILSMVAFAAAAATILAGLGSLRTDDPVREEAEAARDLAAARAKENGHNTEKVGAIAALRWSGTHPRARLGVVATASAHAVMVMVMVMTPLHMTHQDMPLSFVGLVVSMHIMGMYGLSPVFGWATDRYGAVQVISAGLAVLLVSTVMGFIAAGSESISHILTPIALVILGLGWSMCIIAASALLASVGDERVRVPLQGATDALMNFSAAVAAAASGLLLAWKGFEGVNVVAALILIPTAILVHAALKEPTPSDLAAAATVPSVRDSGDTVRAPKG